MKHVQERLDQPERRVFLVLDQPRSTQRYVAIPRDGDEHLVRRLHELVRAHPRRGYRMMCGMLRLDGWRVNVKRVHRLWKREGFRVPGTQHKRRRLGQRHRAAPGRAQGPRVVRGLHPRPRRSRSSVEVVERG